MKKILSVLIMILFVGTLTACDPGTVYYSVDDQTEEVDSIELITYDNSEQKSFRSWIPNHYPDLVDLDISKIVVLEVLDSDQIPMFIEQLSSVEFLRDYYCFNSPKGMCIRLNYSNGDFEILNCDSENNSYIGYVGKYNSDGEVIGFTGTFESFYDFSDLVNDYFENQIVISDNSN